MEKKHLSFWLLGLVLLLLLLFLIFAKSEKQLNPAPDFINEVSPSADLALDFTQIGLFLFTSETCPHCQNVNQYLKQHPEASQGQNLVNVSLDYLPTQKQNQTQLNHFAEVCQVEESAIGIPFLYINDEKIPDSERCLFGDRDIIAYFSLL